MKFSCRLQHRPDGQWEIFYPGEDLGPVRLVHQNPREAVAAMEQELRYRLEGCPCTGQSFQHVPVEIEIAGEPGRGGGRPVTD